MQFVKKSLSVLLSLLMVFSVFTISCGAEKANKASVKDGSFSALALKNWNTDTAGKTALNLAGAVTDGSKTADGIFLAKGQTATFAFNTAEDTYRFGVDYSIEKGITGDIELDVSVDGGDVIRGTLPVLWYDETKKYEKDRNGAEVTPDQVAVTEKIFDVINDEANVNGDDIAYDLNAGAHTVTIKAVNTKVTVSGLYTLTIGSCASYADYIASHKDAKKVDSEIQVEGEAYCLKSESYIRGQSTKNPHLSPYKSGKKKVSTLSGATWSNPGQKISWVIDVPKDGLYCITTHYSCYIDSNQYGYRRVEIDGQVPFEEFNSVYFPSTSSSDYAMHTLSSEDGKPYEVYLTKGEHILSMQVTMGDYVEPYYKLVDLMNEIDEIGLQLEKLSAGSSDSNRTWDMETVLPGTLEKLDEIADRIYAVYDDFKKISVEDPTYVDSLTYAADQMKKILKKPRLLPNKTELIHVGDNSVSKFLGTVVSQLISSPISLDTIYVSSGDEIPERKVSFFTSMFEGFREFFSSFTSNYSSYDANISTKSDELAVWVNRSVQYTEIIQRLLDKGYNLETGSSVKLSIMPSEQKLVLSNAAGTNPDLVLSVGGATPFNFAIRNVAKNLLDYEDFEEYYSNGFQKQALTSLAYNGGIYGMPETMDFNVLFYRTDILDSLGLEVPDTWDDVRYMMPTLLRYNMNFNIALSSASGLKGFGATGPFLFQHSATIYNEDGTATAIDSDYGIEAFKEMTDLYNVYGMQNSIASFYNSFRYGQVPIGIGGSGLYLQLKAAAPEIAGKWSIALAPGTKVDGEVVRYQPANATACMIFKNTKHADEAWALLKWWLGADTQSEYAHLMESTYGPEYFWCSANVEAFRQGSMPEEYKDTVIEQWKWQKELVCHPAAYIVERSSSEVFVNTVVNGKELADSIDNSVLTANREIVRKLKEFGYVNSDGEKIKDYDVNPLDKINLE